MTDTRPIIEVEGISKYFSIRRGLFQSIVREDKPQYVRALEETSFTLERGQSLGIVGETGCGKTTLVKTLLRLYTPTQGRVLFEGNDITDIKGSALRGFRRKAQLIFQDPYESLDPRYTVGEILMEPLKVHKIGNPKERTERVKDMLAAMSLPTTNEMQK